MAGVLAIDQDYDIVTRYGQAFRERLLFSCFATDFAGHKLVRCQNKKATRRAVDAALGADGIHYVTGMGHGRYSTFTGQDGVTIWDALDPKEDFTNLNGRLVHLLSCQTGALLGRSMVHGGVRGFWGYTINFAFYHKRPVPKELHTDEVAEAFLKMDLIVDRGILSGKNAHEIYESVTKYVGSVYAQMKDVAAKAVLLDNYLHLVGPGLTWGDPSAVLEK